MSSKKIWAARILLSAAWAVSIYVHWPRVKQVNVTFTYEIPDEDQPVESAAPPGPVEELTFDQRRAPWVTDAEVKAAADSMYDEAVAELGAEDRECAMGTARLMLEAASPLIAARVRAEERQRAASELQRSFKNTPGVDWGDVVEVSRRILAAEQDGLRDEPSVCGHTDAEGCTGHGDF